MPSPAFDNPLRPGRGTDRSGLASPAGAERAEFDQLLRAIAAHDSSYQEQAGRHSGSVAIALDSVTRWIDRAERRFSELTDRNSRNERLIAHIAALTAATSELHALEMKRQTMQSRNATQQWQQATASRHATRRKRIAALGDILERVTKVLHELDQKICRIEQKLEDKPDTNGRIQALAATLDAHVRLVAQEAQSSRHHFDLMASRIETFAEELRLTRDMHKAAIAYPAEPALPEQNLQIEQPPRAQSIQAPVVNFSTDDNRAGIRSGLIAAARQANRADAGTVRPGNWFLRGQSNHNG